MADVITEVTDTKMRLTGMVKWFNNNAGFGFITVCDGEHAGTDIFTHYSSIRVTNSQYKYLVQGEYVDFTLVTSESQAHEYQAIDVCGVKGGAIMCETTRAAYQSSRSPQYENRSSPRYETRSSPRYETRSSPQYENRSSPRFEKRQPVKRAAPAPASAVQAPDSEGFTKVVRKVPKSLRAKA